MRPAVTLFLLVPLGFLLALPVCWSQVDFSVREKNDHYRNGALRCSITIKYPVYKGSSEEIAKINKWIRETAYEYRSQNAFKPSQNKRKGNGAPEQYEWSLNIHESMNGSGVAQLSCSEYELHDEGIKYETSSVYTVLCDFNTGDVFPDEYLLMGHGAVLEKVRLALASGAYDRYYFREEELEYSVDYQMGYGVLLVNLPYFECMDVIRIFQVRIPLSEVKEYLTPIAMRMYH